MGIFDRFPYSSTHEMNLDFMLGKATEIAESLQEIDTHKEQAEQAATNAAQSAQSAAQAAQAAAGSQTAAGTSASQAAQHKADAEDAADRAEAAWNGADEAAEQAQTATERAIENAAATANLGEAPIAYGNGTWKWTKLGYVTPEMFGAKGDGITDDSTALNNMFENGGSILIPPKTYYCAQNIIVNEKCSIMGAGHADSIIKLADSKTLTISAADTVVYNIKFLGGQGVVCNIYHVTWLGCIFTQSKIGLQLNSAYINQIISCYLIENIAGIVLNHQAYQVVINSCVIDNNSGAGVIICGGQSSPVIDNCTIEGNYNRTTGNGCGILVCSINNALRINNCHFEANGTGEESTDFYTYMSDATMVTNIAALNTHIDNVYSEIGLSVTKYRPEGKIVISGCRFFGTKYGMVLGGSSLSFNAHDCSFGGIINKNNKPVLLNANDIIATSKYCFDNNVVFSADSDINAEMLNGIKKSYIFCDLAFNSDYLIKKLKDGWISLDSKPLYVYYGKLSDLTTSTIYYPRLYNSEGTSHEGGLANNNLTNYYTGISSSSTISPDGRETTIFPTSGVNTFVIITNGKIALINTSDLGWRSVESNIINTYNLATQFMYFSASQVEAIAYCFISLSDTDKGKMQGCIYFEPTDLVVHEWRA